MEYAIKIDGKYLYEYVYAENNRKGRFGKIQFYAGDIIDAVLTDDVQRTEVRGSIGGTIQTLYAIPAMEGKKVEIIPIGRD